jgi:putative hydrolase of the HAD superfamily
LHYTVYQEKLRVKEQLELEDLFDKTYFSFKIGMRKPDKEIFEYVLKENNIEAKECLFIDDSKEHIETAEKLGIQCIHLVNRDLCSVFNTQDLSIIF